MPDTKHFTGLAAGDPSGYIFDADRTQHVVYRAGDGHIHELWWNDAQGWHHGDLTSVTGAPVAAGDPSGYMSNADRTQHVIYRAGDGHIHELWWNDAQGWHHGDLTSVTGAPVAAGDPSGYMFNADRTQHVIYRARDGHIHELWWNDAQGWHHGDLTSVTGAPVAAGDPSGYLSNADRTQHVVYRAGDGHIHELWWNDAQGWHHGDLTSVTGAPVAAGDPSGYMSNADRTQHVVYRAGDGHIHELWWNDAQGWHHGDLTSVTGAPVAAGNPSGYMSNADRTQHVVYRAGDGHIHELWWNDAQGWHHGDLTSVTGAPVAAGDPSGYMFDADRTQHVVYRAGDGHIHELWWNDVQGWHDGDLTPGRFLTKRIPLKLLRQKFDVFFNQRIRPLFQIRLDGAKFGVSTLTVAFDDPLTSYDHHNLPKLLHTLELAAPGEVLSYPGLLYGVHPFRFSDVKSDKVTLTILPGPPLGIEVLIRFETGGVEMRVEDRPNIDFDGFNIKLKMEFGVHNNLVDLAHFVDEIDVAMSTMEVTPNLLKWTFRGKVNQRFVIPALVNKTKELIKSELIKTFVNTDVSVNANWEPDGLVADSIENIFNKRIFEALSAERNRDSLNKIVTRWLVGGDFDVVGVASDNQSLSIDYVIPPGQLEPFPETPQPALNPGLLANIDHIVVLMMENRSFDHMLGYLSKEGGRSDVDGLRGGETNSDGKGHNFSSYLLPTTIFDESPDHSYQPVLNQINGGKMDGFVTSFIAKFPGIDNPGKIMGYYNAAQLPVYDALAREFMICNRWFAAHPGPTFCNRFYTLTGRLNRDSTGNVEFNNFHGDNFKPVLTRTIFDHLTDRGVSWRYYEHRYCSLRLFERYTFDDNNHIVDALDPVKGFFASAAAGTLPSVSFIDPNFIDEPDMGDNDDAAPGNIAAGQHLIGQVVNKLVNGPKWNKTLLVITYDEHGGFYDHVSPLAFRATAKPVSGIDHYGVRVPTFVVSPWVDRRVVTDVVFDFTSIAKTIARRFMSANPPDMGERVAAANDLSMVLRSTVRQDKPNIPVPPAPAAHRALARGAVRVPESDDFKAVLRTLRSRYASADRAPIANANTSKL